MAAKPLVCCASAMRSGGAHVCILPSRVGQGGLPCAMLHTAHQIWVKADRIVFQALLHGAFSEQIMQQGC